MNRTNTSPLAIAMWDFSWLERRWSGAGYEDWGRSLDELAERGYNAVRIDAFPHLLAAGASRSWRLLPTWNQEAWGATEPVDVRVQPELIKFMTACRDRGLAVAFSSWFRKDTQDIRMRLDTAEKFANAWIQTLQSVKDAGLADVLYYVDLANEWPIPVWTPFLYTDGASARLASRADPRIARFRQEAVALVRAAHPEFRYTVSNATELTGAPAEDVSDLDLLEVHVWMSHEEVSTFAAQIDYEIWRSAFNPQAYVPLSGPAEALYRLSPQHWQQLLHEQVLATADWSRRAGRPLATTECWSIVNYKDGPGRDWGWIKELCAAGVHMAADTGRWEALATSNFCGPQFVGMWRDVDWHRNLTDHIKKSPIDSELVASS